MMMIMMMMMMMMMMIFTPSRVRKCVNGLPSKFLHIVPEPQMFKYWNTLWNECPKYWTIVKHIFLKYWQHCCWHISSSTYHYSPYQNNEIIFRLAPVCKYQFSTLAEIFGTYVKLRLPSPVSKMHPHPITIMIIIIVIIMNIIMIIMMIIAIIVLIILRLIICIIMTIINTMCSASLISKVAPYQQYFIAKKCI